MILSNTHLWGIRNGEHFMAGNQRLHIRTSPDNHLQTRNRYHITFLLLAFTQIALISTAYSAEVPERWENLLANDSLAAWRNYQSQNISDGWSVSNGTLQKTGRNAGDLITREQYSDFELELEWRVENGGNSGIFFRATEAEPRIYLSAPEVQILDDNHHKDGRSPLTSAGSNYALHPAPRGVVRSAGAWNQVRLRVEGDQVSQWLNNQLIVEYQLGSEDWQQRVANSKFAKWPSYGKAASGHIGLQDHGDPVAFRNIRIRRLEPPK